MSADQKMEHDLALKVMRLTRPSLAPAAATVTPFTARAAPPGDSPGSLFEGGDFNSGLSSCLVLPQSFGSIYLGETFVCYVSLHNDSTETCDSLQLHCHLQTVTQRLPLLQTPPPSKNAVQTLTIESGESIDHVLNHEVKELGTHILVCEVNYASPSEGKKNFRKYFKFQVMKPLDVKTKFYNAENDDVFLEAQVQNVTSGPLCLEKVGLDPSPMFRATSLNRYDEDGDHKLVFGKVNFLQPQDSRQYLFSLTPRNDLKMNYKQLKGATNIGKLDIIWRTNFGDKGRLQTSQLQRLSPIHGDLRIVVDSIPSVVLLGEPFAMGFTIVNNSERTLELEMALENAKQPKMLWSGSCFKKLGLLEPAGTTEVVLEAVAQDISLQSLSGIKITDNLLKRSYNFDDLCQVYVCKDEAFVRG